MPRLGFAVRQHYAWCAHAGCLQSLCRAAGEVVDATLKAVNKDPEDEPLLEVVAALYSDKTAGEDDSVNRTCDVLMCRNLMDA